MRIIKKSHVLLIISLLLFSCGGKTEKSWIVTDFSEGNIFKISAKDNRTYTSAIVYIEGKVDKSLCFRRNLNDKNECRNFSKDTTYMKSRYDFYGGTFTYQLLPSEATGEVKVSIELPYH